MRLFLRTTAFVLTLLLLGLAPGYGAQPTASQSLPISPGPIPKASEQLQGKKTPPASPAPIAASGAVPPVVKPQLESPTIVSEQPPVTVAGEPTALPVRQEFPMTDARSEMSKKVQVAVERLVNAIVYMDGVTLFGLAAIVAMVVFYCFEHRSPFFILAFAMACWLGSVYAFLQWPWPFGIVVGIWGFVALWKWWQEVKSNNSSMGQGDHHALLWPTRFLYVFAVICAVVLLIVDSPISTYLSIPISHAAVEAAPLLFVGIAYLAWLAIDRPATANLIAQALIAAAFILWGVDLLMPTGPWATFVGAVVISIYVFDLAWLMEGNLRKKFGARASGTKTGPISPNRRSTGVCQSDDISGYSRNNHEAAGRSEAPLGSTSK
jgi:hypothetical protein